jgi:hypothetical protein
MERPTLSARRSFDVVAFYSSDGDRFARAQFRIEVANDRSPYAAARLCAERKPYADPRIPVLAIFLIVTPVPTSGAGPFMVSSTSALPAAVEVGSYVVLSTAHVRCSTGQILDRWAELSMMEQPLAVSRTNYGWFVLARDAVVQSPMAIPEEMPAILEFARSHGCDHVLFDCDGPEEPTLRLYPW